MIGYTLKGSSQAEIYDFAKEFFAEQGRKSTEAIIQQLKKDNKTQKSLVNAFDELFLRCKKLQQGENKGRIRYIHIFFLKSCLFTEKYEIQITLFDEQSYADKCYVYELWNPEVFTQYFQKDLKCFREKNNLILFDYHKFQDIKFKYYHMFLTLIGQFIIQEIRHVAELPSYGAMEKHPEIQFIYGGYMDKGFQVYPAAEVII